MNANARTPELSTREKESSAAAIPDTQKEPA
jgi:hypothetical protein